MPGGRRAGATRKRTLTGEDWKLNDSADISREEVFRPLPAALREEIARLEPAPAGSMGDLPDWATTLIARHSDDSVDVGKLPGLTRSTDPDDETVGIIEFEGVCIEFENGGSARAFVATPKEDPASAWMHSRLTDYWDMQVGAIETACGRLELLEGDERERALTEIERAVTEHVRVLDDEHLIQASLPFGEDLYKAANWIARMDQGLFDYLRVSAGTLSRLLAEKGIQIQYLVDNHWEDPRDLIELFSVWFRAAGFNFICPQDLARQIAMSNGAMGEDEIESQAPGHLAEARRVANEYTRECQELGGHIVVLDNDGEEETWTQALTRRGAPGVVTIYRSAAPEPGSKVSAWFPEH